MNPLRIGLSSWRWPLVGALAVAAFYEKFDALYAKFKSQQDAENERKTAEYYASLPPVGAAK